jgi:hypothetical protein
VACSASSNKTTVPGRHEQAVVALAAASEARRWGSQRDPSGFQVKTIDRIIETTDPNEGRQGVHDRLRQSGFDVIIWGRGPIVAERTHEIRERSAFLTIS